MTRCILVSYNTENNVNVISATGFCMSSFTLAAVGRPWAVIRASRGTALSCHKHGLAHPSRPFLFPPQTRRALRSATRRRFNEIGATLKFDDSSCCPARGSHQPWKVMPHFLPHFSSVLLRVMWAHKTKKAQVRVEMKSYVIRYIEKIFFMRWLAYTLQSCLVHIAGLFHLNAV